jgi:hypothetical protein
MAKQELSGATSTQMILLRPLLIGGCPRICQPLCSTFHGPPPVCAVSTNVDAKELFEGRPYSRWPLMGFVPTGNFEWDLAASSNSWAARLSRILIGGLAMVTVTPTNVQKIEFNLYLAALVIKAGFDVLIEN